MLRTEYPKCSCIYQIQSKANGEIYIGCTYNFIMRKSGHLGSLRNNTHHSFLLQEHYNKYGEQDLIFDVVERIHKQGNESDNQFRIRLYIIETNYIHKLNPSFNIAIPHYPLRKKPEGYFDIPKDYGLLFKSQQEEYYKKVQIREEKEIKHFKEARINEKRIQQLVRLHQSFCGTIQNLHFKKKNTHRKEYPINHVAWEVYIAYLEVTYLGKEQQFVDMIEKL